MITDFVFRGEVVCRFSYLILSSSNIQFLVSQLSDYYGALDDSEITVVQY